MPRRHMHLITASSVANIWAASGAVEAAKATTVSADRRTRASNIVIRMCTNWAATGERGGDAPDLTATVAVQPLQELPVGHPWDFRRQVLLRHFRQS